MYEFYEPSQCERQGAPRAFKYELEMLRFAASKYSNAQDKLLRNALVECALLHARNLLDFFWRKQPPKNDDICAAHFVGKSAKRKSADWWRSCKLPYLKSHKTTINKSLSHLTYERIGAEYKWDLAKIKDEIEAAYTEFLQLLPQEDQAKWPPPEDFGTDKPKADGSPKVKSNIKMQKAKM